MLLFALLPAVAQAWDLTKGDQGGAIAALIEEALRLGIDPAKHAGIVFQQGAAEGTRATQAARPAPPAPLTDDEKALNFAADHAAQNGSTVHDFTNGVTGRVNVNPGAVIVCGGTVYKNTGINSIGFISSSAADAKSSCDLWVRENAFTVIYP